MSVSMSLMQGGGGGGGHQQAILAAAQPYYQPHQTPAHTHTQDVQPDRPIGYGAFGVVCSPMASLVLTGSSQLTSDSQHSGIYSSPMASLVLTGSSQLTSDSQHLEVSCELSVSTKEAMGLLYYMLA
uniref:Uncharacterized protein n=1 Tax=Timema douglasi TaxID=61478 RepID=A0A7R8VLW4_TIMDO|nr:unnamed protein product [Timema douglasi]